MIAGNDVIHLRAPIHVDVERRTPLVQQSKDELASEAHFVGHVKFATNKRKFTWLKKTNESFAFLLDFSDHFGILQSSNSVQITDQWFEIDSALLQHVLHKIQVVLNDQWNENGFDTKVAFQFVLHDFAARLKFIISIK